jgi:site-specific DNA recombinase
MSRPRRVFGYARVSSEEQAKGTSLQDQQAAIAAYAEQQGVRVTQFYVEAESGIREKTERREQMRALMRDVSRGDLVLVDKIDRWSRDPEFTYSSVRKILECGASFYAVGEGIDPSTNEGDSQMSFRILFAREEHKRIRIRMVGTRHLLRDKGYWVEGVVPFGYRRPDAKGLERNVLLVEPTEAEAVRRVFNLATRGRSIAEIQAAVAMKRDRVMDILHRRFYTGELTSSKGEWIAGRHPAIVDKATFQRARDSVGSRRWSPLPGAPARTDDWFLRDVAVCGHCGGKMGAAYGSKGSVYYRCRAKCSAKGPQANTGSYIEVRGIESLAAPLVLEKLREMRTLLAAPALERVVPDFSEQRARLRQKKARITDAFTDGALSRDEHRARLAKVDEELLRLDAEEERQARPADRRPRREVLRELRELERAWKVAGGVRRRAIVNELVERAYLLPDAPPVLVFRDAEDLVAEE